MPVVTLEQIYELQQQTLSAVRQYNAEQIKLLRQILAKLDEIHEGIKTLSDNQVVIYDKLVGDKG